MKKRARTETTNEVIESEPQPELEQAYVKVGGHAPRAVGDLRTKHGVSTEIYEVEEYLDDTESTGKPYSHIHSHLKHYESREPNSPNFKKPQTYPSFKDIQSFLMDSKRRFMVISQQDPQTGEESGRLIFKKPSKHDTVFTSRRAIIEEAQEYEQAAALVHKERFKQNPQFIKRLDKEFYRLSSLASLPEKEYETAVAKVKDPEEINRKVAVHYGLQYRFQSIPPKHARKKQSALESAVAAGAIIVSSILLIALTSLNLTGYITYNSEGTSVDFASLIILIAIITLLSLLIAKKLGKM